MCEHLSRAAAFGIILYAECRPTDDLPALHIAAIGGRWTPKVALRTIQTTRPLQPWRDVSRKVNKAADCCLAQFGAPTAASTIDKYVGRPSTSSNHLNIHLA